LRQAYKEAIESIDIIKEYKTIEVNKTIDINIEGCLYEDKKEIINFDKTDDFIYEISDDDKKLIDNFWRNSLSKCQAKSRRKRKKYWLRMLRANEFKKYRRYIYFQIKYWEFFSYFEVNEFGEKLLLKYIYPFLVDFYSETHLDVRLIYDLDSLMTEYINEVKKINEDYYEMQERAKENSKLDLKTVFIIFVILLSIYISGLLSY